ncbi:glycosyltransferase family 4 protein [Brevibacillus humidisoli]|uniref:glycosyltransferase family 4 protein n=1 Tax=Brevibacillus humidisoli TaxID=2895522 RepID=UPI001E3A9FC8|nr:glycosyltransferase family 4 protein [Brevibacillus humidisoli]UFJ42520.1 glycosyltransferase family 4 protein [Brevibacillus humidisoli]
MLEKVMLISHDANLEMVSGSEKALLTFGAACQELPCKLVWISPRPGMSLDRAVQMGMEAKAIPFPLLWSLIHFPQRLREEILLLEQTLDENPLHREIANVSPDLIVSNSVINALPALIARRRGVPVWWYIHEVMTRFEPADDLRRVIHSHADRILVPSASVAKSVSLSNEPSNKIELLPYGVKLPSAETIADSRKRVRDAEGWTGNHIVIGWFGSIYAGKGLVDFIRAAARLANGDKTIVILAAGNVIHPGYFHICQQEAKNIKTAVCRYVGPLATIDEMLPAVDLVVIPSRVEEAFPNVALEAMAYAKPVVGYQSGGLKEIVVHGETGLLVRTGEIGLLAASLQALIDDPDKSGEMGTKGRERVGRLYEAPLFASRVRRMLTQS